MDTILPLIGRQKPLFAGDIEKLETEIAERIACGRFLVLGGAGSIGQAVSRELFRRNPLKLDIVDISENNLVELVRDLRSSLGYIKGEFRTFAIDIGSGEFDLFMKENGDYDYILNLSALKHVRSESDPYTLMRMINVNIFNTDKSILQALESDCGKYFCVSTDKAANPVNMMGASKRIMELFLIRRSADINISTARFANVAFSDGSLLHGFNQRLAKNQPIVAPRDIKRYFVTPQESGELCLMSCLFGENRDIFFPKLDETMHLVSFSDIACQYLRNQGLEPLICESEEEARQLAARTGNNKQWPCLFTDSDTTGEKQYEEFYTDAEHPDLQRFESIGVVKLELNYQQDLLEKFESGIAALRKNQAWDRPALINLFKMVLPDFQHLDKGKFLDSKM